MCGFLGEALEPEGRRDRERFHAALQALHHRGPDDSGVYSDDAVQLGSTRLSILDLSDSGHMPMVDPESGLVLVYNGEVYNAPALRSELAAQGVSFKSNGDTEVVLKLLSRQGPEALSRLRGMFALGCWDPRHRTLLLARDLFGIKPLYYEEISGRLVFASEAGALYRLNPPSNEVSVSALSDYLAFGYITGGKTLRPRVRKLQAGNYLLWSPGGVPSGPLAGKERSLGIHAYEDPIDLVEPPPKDDGREWVDRVRSGLRESVQAHLLSDVPLGVFLSGGIDSSAIAAFACQASSDLSTFSVGFEGPAEFNELSRARVIAKRFGTRHHELLLDGRDLREQIFPLVAKLDDPPGDAAFFPMYALSNVAANSVKVVLTGEGGDEMFGGYRRYGAERASSLYRGVPRALVHGPLKAATELMPGMSRLKRGLAALEEDDPVRRALAWQRVWSEGEIAGVLAPAFMRRGGRDLEAYGAFYSRGLSRLDPLGAMMYADLKSRLAEGYCEKVDRSTMAASLEARVPFLDREVCRVAISIPSRLKVRRFKLKRILREALRGILPDSFLALPKRGFAVPYAAWFRTSLKDLLEETLSAKEVERYGILDPSAVRALVEEFLKGKRPVAERVWSLFALQVWCRVHLTGAAQAAP